MNHIRIARLYLSWFEQEASNLGVSSSTGSNQLIWSDGGSYVIGYTGAQGFRSYQGFVQALAGDRLPEADAAAVLSAAISTVTGDQHG